MDYKLYNLVLDKEKSTEAVLYGIDGAVADGNGFTATARNKFVVNPEISRGATFKVFADASCSQLIEDNTVAIAKDTTVYIIVTSESGTNVSALMRLRLKNPMRVLLSRVKPSTKAIRRSARLRLKITLRM